MSLEAARPGEADRSARGLLACLAVAAMPALSFGGDQPVWTHESGSENWVGRVVSIGDDGNQVLSAMAVTEGRIRLFSAFDTNPPTPILESQLPAYTYRHAVDSASSADVHVTLHCENPQQGSSNTPVMQRYTSQAGVTWSYTFPLQVLTPNGGVAVSDDGDVLIGWVFNSSTGKTALASFTGTSGTPVQYLQLSTSDEPKVVSISSDGRLVYLASTIKTMVVDPLTGQILHLQTNWEGVGSGHALASDGSRFVQVLPLNRIAVYRRQGDGFVLETTLYGDEGTICSRLGLSGDGDFLAATFDHTSTWQRVDVRGYDLSQPGSPVVLQDTTIGAGTFNNLTSDLSVARDGSAFVVGLWGDELGLSPEVRVYGRDSAGWRLRATHDLPGSVNDVDMSPDGQRFAVASKAIHANQVGGDGRIDLFEVEQPELRMVGVPSAGEIVTFEQASVPGGSGRLLFAPALAPEPTTWPNIGTLYLDRTQLSPMPVRYAGPDGVIRTDYTVPSNPSLVGSTLYFQGVGLSPRSFTDNWVKLTILP